METGKTGKYFKYAIGEIVLVVIGILIALSINNWNEEKNANAIVKSYLRNIKNDMIADSIELLNRSERNIKLISNIEEYFDYFDNGTWTTQEIVDSAKNTETGLYSYGPNYSAYNEMLTTGYTKLLKEDLRTELASRKIRQDRFVEIMDKFDNNYTEENIELRKYWPSQSKIKHDFFERTGLPALENNLINGLRHRHQQLSMNINKAIEFNKRAQRLQPGELIKLIDEELN